MRPQFFIGARVPKKCFLWVSFFFLFLLPGTTVLVAPGRKRLVITRALALAAAVELPTVALAVCVAAAVKRRAQIAVALRLCVIYCRGANARLLPLVNGCLEAALAVRLAIQSEKVAVSVDKATARTWEPTDNDAVALFPDQTTVSLTVVPEAVCALTADGGTVSTCTCALFLFAGSPEALAHLVTTPQSLSLPHTSHDENTGAGVALLVLWSAAVADVGAGLGAEGLPEVVRLHKGAHLYFRVRVALVLSCRRRAIRLWEGDTFSVQGDGPSIFHTPSSYISMKKFFLLVLGFQMFFLLVCKFDCFLFWFWFRCPGPRAWTPSC
jgi:hypothetical protein